MASHAVRARAARNTRGATAAGAYAALVVSDVRFHREGLVEAIVTARPGSAVRSCDGASVASSQRGFRPDVVIVELAAGCGRALEQLRTVVPGAPIVGLVLMPEADVVVAATAYGVRAFVGPDESLADLIGTVARASAGEAVCPPAVASLLFDRLASDGDATTSSVLSPRERDVAVGLAKGLSNKEIAGELFVEPATVKNHVHNILRKLRVHRRGEAAALLRTRT